MELSTNIPTPSASPPKEMMFSVKPLKYISAKVVITETGIATPMMAVLEMLRRKKNRTKTANPEPIKAASRRFEIAPRMNLD